MKYPCFSRKCASDKIIPTTVFENYFAGMKSNQNNKESLYLKSSSKQKPTLIATECPVVL
jgi:hypothetical protein